MRAAGRWNQILERQIPLKLLSSPAAPFEHQSSISICLTVTSYKIATWKRENVSLSVYASTVCAYVCSVMCFHNSLSESAYLRVPTFKTQQLHQSSLLSPLISHHPTSCSLALRLHLSFQPSLLSVSFSSSLVSLFFSFLFLTSHFHLHSLSSIFPLWQWLTFSLGDGPKLDSTLPSAPAGLLHPQTLQASSQNSSLASSSSNHEESFHLFALALLLSHPSLFSFHFKLWIFTFKKKYFNVCMHSYDPNLTLTKISCLWGLMMMIIAWISVMLIYSL